MVFEKLNSRSTEAIFMVMKSFAISIPENKGEISSEIKQQHKDIVRIRIQVIEEHPENCLQWEDIERKIQL
jgi:hypothetical protein